MPSPSFHSASQPGYRTQCKECPQLNPPRVTVRALQRGSGRTLTPPSARRAGPAPPRSSPPTALGVPPPPAGQGGATPAEPPAYAPRPARSGPYSELADSEEPQEPLSLPVPAGSAPSPPAGSIASAAPLPPGPADAMTEGHVTFAEPSHWPAPRAPWKRREARGPPRWGQIGHCHGNCHGPSRPRPSNGFLRLNRNPSWRTRLYLVA